MTPEALDLDRLKALAEAASKGPWTAHNAETREDGSPGCAWGVEQANGQIVVLHDFVAPNDAAFIAAHNPETILRLLAELSRLRGEVERLQQALLDADGCSCAYCPSHADMFIEARKGTVEPQCVICLALAAEQEKGRQLREWASTLSQFNIGASVLAKLDALGFPKAQP